MKLDFPSGMQHLFEFGAGEKNFNWHFPKGTRSKRKDGAYLIFVDGKLWKIGRWSRSFSELRRRYHVDELRDALKHRELWHDFLEAGGKVQIYGYFRDLPIVTCPDPFFGEAEEKRTKGDWYETQLLDIYFKTTGTYPPGNFQELAKLKQKQ